MYIMKEEKVLWFAARRKVWAWIHGNKDEIDALWERVRELEQRLNEIYPK